MKSAFFALAILIFSAVQSHACLPPPLPDEIDRLDLIHSAYYVGPVNILTLDPVQPPSLQFEASEKGSALRIQQALSPSHVMKVKFFDDYRGAESSGREIEVFPAEDCAPEIYNSDSIIESMIIEKQGKFYFSPRNRIKKEEWQKFREKKALPKFIVSKKLECVKRGGRWIFPPGGIAECAE